MAKRYAATTCGRIQLGRQGENLAREIAFDISDWREEYGNGSVHLIYQRCGDLAPYPVAITMDEGTVLWSVTDADTDKPGIGSCELRYLVGDVVVKSCVYATWVTASLCDTTGNTPYAARDWVNEVLEASESVKTAQASPPKIGDNGNWCVWDFGKGQYTDTGVQAGSQDEIYDGVGKMPEGYKLQLFGNEHHNRRFIRFDARLSAPIYGTITDDKVVTLNGDLQKGVYEFKIVLADGSTADLCTYEVV